MNANRHSSADDGGDSDFEEESGSAANTTMTTTMRDLLEEQRARELDEAAEPLGDESHCTRDDNDDDSDGDGCDNALVRQAKLARGVDAGHKPWQPLFVCRTCDNQAFARSWSDVDSQNGGTLNAAPPPLRPLCAACVASCHAGHAGVESLWEKRFVRCGCANGDALLRCTFAPCERTRNMPPSSPRNHVSVDRRRRRDDVEREMLTRT
jgi:hypothetical protein